MKKPSKKGLRRKCDILWSQVIKLRAHEKCEYCGSPNHLNSHHVYGRRGLSTRYDIFNGCCLCAGCHKFSNKFSAHETPALFIDWIRKERGEEWYRQLRERHSKLEHDFDYLETFNNLLELHNNLVLGKSDKVGGTDGE